MSEEYRNYIVPYTEAWDSAQILLDSLDPNSKYYNLNVFLLKSFQATLESQADSIRISYYQTLTNPSQAEIDAAKQAGYYFAKTVDLGAGFSFRKDPGSAGNGTQDHVHVNGPNGQHWSQNKDGSIHDQGKNSPGEPPNWVKKDLKKKGKGWDWDANKQSQYDSHYYSPDSPYSPVIPVLPVFPRIIII